MRTDEGEEEGPESPLEDPRFVLRLFLVLLAIGLLCALPVLVAARA
jgi:hypothetical protein